jgi:hypothetical protein
MIIITKFASACGKCGERIDIGESVNWERGQRATHATPCQPVFGAHSYAPVRIAVEDAGVYVLPDGGIVKVKANRDKSRTYALRWTPINGERLTEAGTRERGEYVFEAGLVQTVAANGRKMTLTEAKAFTLRYGVCCRCGRKLVAAESVERAIGPICVQYFGQFGA